MEIVCGWITEHQIGMAAQAFPQKKNIKKLQKNLY